MRSASFTAAGVGKAAATSGSSSTRLVPCRNRGAYFPRVPPRKSLTSYSARSSSLLVFLTFLIGFPFAANCGASAADSRSIASISITDQQQSASDRHAHCNISVLVHRVIGIIHGDRKRIVECRSLFGEVD